jgi:uncharacterized coiled-coil protein SlyX
MNRVNQCKTVLLVLISGPLACLTLSAPKAFGVLPPPDGGYPGGNTAEGQAALLSLTTGGFNTAVGWQSLRTITTAKFNTGVGAGTLALNIADENTATGAGALLTTTGGFNTATGAFALLSNTTGIENVANGNVALFSNTIGSANTANGASALQNNSTGTANTADGNGALAANTTGSFNTALGAGAGAAITTANAVIAIGHAGANLNGTCFIANIRGVQTQNANAIPVLIDSVGQLGTASSSRRFKKEITPMDKTSEAVLALKPVTFQYKSDSTGTPQFGLIAEEVAKVNPDLVVRDNNGEIYTVRYEAVNAMLLNEFLKEHCKVEQQEQKLAQQETTIAQLKSAVTKQEATAAEQRKAIAALTAGLQRVSAQVEMSRPAPRMVVTQQ